VDLWGGPELRPALAEVVAAWPLGASLAAAVVLRGRWAGRRRTALNEALHELRRPLQTLALVGPGGRQIEPATIQGSVLMAASALERLEREINGDAPEPARATVLVQPLLDSAVSRWIARARLSGNELSLCWEAGGATVEGDERELAQLLDNLIVNAIEHGGPEVVVVAKCRLGRLCVAVIDSGREARPESRRESPAELIARLSGRRRHGHGLRVVRRIAAAHGGHFQLRSSGRRTEAVLELPLAGSRGGA
jgi:signal transduction histidine kinase